LHELYCQQSCRPDSQLLCDAFGEYGSTLCAARGSYERQWHFYSVCPCNTQSGPTRFLHAVRDQSERDPACFRQRARDFGAAQDPRNPKMGQQVSVFLVNGFCKGDVADNRLASSPSDVVSSSGSPDDSAGPLHDNDPSDIKSRLVLSSESAINQRQPRGHAD